MPITRPALLALAVSACTPAWASPHARSFDYVIVGGGTAGLTVANRLTENASVTVAVIEAGTFPEDVVGNISQVPAYATLFSSTELSNLEIEWGFETTPQAGKNGSVVDYPRAKALGGCSVANSMAYSHSSVGAFQLWADTVGDQSYTYENVVKYYHKSMNFTPPDSETRLANATPLYDSADVVTGGPLSVTYAAYSESWSTWVAKGMAAVGILPTDSFINGNLNGSAWQLQTVNHADGHRASAEVAYLRPYLSRPNLVLFTETMAERILFNDRKAAKGVEVTTANTTYTIRARKEVIVSAGVFQSPQLLMVSGVGPAAVLEEYDIPVVADRPGVGQGMNDHIFVPLTYRTNLESQSTVTVEDMEEFNNDATGPLTNPGGDYLGLEKIPQALRANWSAETVEVLSKLPSDWPEAEYLFLPAALFGDTVEGAAYGTALAALVAPQSRGNVTIASSKMSVAPLINPNWFTAQADKDVLLAAFKRVREFFASDAMSSILIGDEFLPGPSVQTDDEILEYIVEGFYAISHASATNHMGKSSNPMAVVDSKGKVFGVKSLRVIDASVFPFLPPGPAPQAHVYMLAEKLADQIKKEW
ncbi:hypothetical protein ARAM_002426 [Aspergillus rambellii]|uniref:Glucose-methanol-choline oxidoreductase N-terminal domain-containing protein n=1 Tax=Aspergillus rambellii TaxID=308745 RepID=A0A0F8VB77_9EURO|nr:hypothetical protein ARAM_002426 [Aspergillus rambellii]